MKRRVPKLGDDEHVIRIVRKHWFILLSQIIGLIVIYLAPLLLYRLFTGLLSANAVLEVSIPASVGTFLFAAWSLIVWMKLFGIWTNYYLDTWTITNERIIDIDQKGFFRRHIASFRLERLQDITIEINGFIATMLNFGTMHVQTAGEQREFVIRGIPDPRGVKAVILDQSDSAMATVIAKTD